MITGTYGWTTYPAASAATWGDLMCTERVVLWVEWTWNSTYYSSNWYDVAGYYWPFSTARVEDGTGTHQIRVAGVYGQVVHTYPS